MKKDTISRTNSVLEEFMNLFILEMKYNTDVLEHRLIPEMAEALQICLEPECYEDVPLIKNVQEYANQLVMEKEKQQSTFQEEVITYLNEVFHYGKLDWIESEVVNLWNHYTEFEKMRMLDFMRVYDGVYHSVARYHEAFQGGNQK